MSFPKRDSTHWRSASWRDSDAGYAGGRFAMDINAIWVPQALEAIGDDPGRDAGARLEPGGTGHAGARSPCGPLGRYVRIA